MKTVDSVKLVQKERYSILEAAQALKSDLPVTRVILFGSKARVLFLHRNKDPAPDRQEVQGIFQLQYKQGALLFCVSLPFIPYSKSYSLVQEETRSLNLSSALLL